jgi:GntR family transcriptional regulator, transcriptional repressor for pyruvate dehydrogenase complex
MTALPPASQTTVVIDGIKAMITDGLLAPGDRLPVERDLAARFGVSRSSLREGVRALATLGIVETRQGAGTYVTSLEPAHLLGPVGLLADITPAHRAADLLAVRRVLESEAVALAARHATDAELDAMEAILADAEARLAGSEAGGAGPDDLAAAIESDTAFHRAIAVAGRNGALAALVDGLMSHTLRTRLWRAVTESGSMHDAHREHRDILAGLRSRDPDLARLRMAVHLVGVERYALTHPDPGPADPADPDPEEAP